MNLLSQWYASLLLVMSFCNVAQAMEHRFSRNEFNFNVDISSLVSFLRAHPLPPGSSAEVLKGPNDSSKGKEKEEQPRVKKDRRKILKAGAESLNFNDPELKLSIIEFFKADCSSPKNICYTEGGNTDAVLAQKFKGHYNGNKFYFSITWDDYRKLHTLYRFIFEQATLLDKDVGISNPDGILFKKLLQWGGHFNFNDLFPTLDKFHITTREICNVVRRKLTEAKINPNKPLSLHNGTVVIIPQDGYEVPIIKIKKIQPKDKLKYLEGLSALNLKLGESLNLLSDSSIHENGALIDASRELKKSFYEVARQIHIFRFTLMSEKISPSSPPLVPFLKSSKWTIDPYQQAGRQLFQLEYLLNKQAYELKNSIVVYADWIKRIEEALKGKFSITYKTGLEKDLAALKLPVLSTLKQDYDEVEEKLSDYIAKLSPFSFMNPRLYQPPKENSDELSKEKEKEIPVSTRKPTFSSGVKILSTVCAPMSSRQAIYYLDRDGLMKRKVVQLVEESSN